MGLNRLAAFSCTSLLLILVWAGPAQADGFSSGQFVTYTQAAWGWEECQRQLRCSLPITTRCIRELLETLLSALPERQDNSSSSLTAQVRCWTFCLPLV